MKPPVSQRTDLGLRIQRPGMSKSFERLPVEVWEHILYLVVDSTLLLSLDPFKCDQHAFRIPDDWVCPMYDIDEDSDLYWGMKDQPAMRQFRRLRARLRLVCRNWKRFADLPSIEHRIARLCSSGDREETMSSEMLVAAKRIEFVDPRRNPRQQIDGLVREAVESGQDFNAEIVIDVGGLLSIKVLRQAPQRFRYLSALHIDISDIREDSLSEYKLHGIFAHYPLVFLSILSHKRIMLPVDDFRLSRLVSLNLCSDSLQGLGFGMWKLPKLRHLRLSGLRNPAHPTRFVKYLWRFGAGLTYLSLTPNYHWDLWNISISSIWKQCPKLEHLEIPLYLVLKEFDLPPVNWPLTHLVNTIEGSMSSEIWNSQNASQDVMSFYGHIIRFCHGCPRLAVITDGHIWSDVLIRVYAPMSETMKDSTSPQVAIEQAKENEANATFTLARKLDAIGIRYEDRHKKTFAEATAFRG